ncbi:MAG: hypothetical protein U1E37_10795 [Sphingomonadaceae bacterium]
MMVRTPMLVIASGEAARQSRPTVLITLDCHGPAAIAMTKGTC